MPLSTGDLNMILNKKVPSEETVFLHMDTLQILLFNYRISLPVPLVSPLPQDPKGDIISSVAYVLGITQTIIWLKRNLTRPCSPLMRHIYLEKRTRNEKRQS